MRKWLTLFITAYFFLSFFPCFAEERGILLSDESSRDNSSRSEIEISVFAAREDAERLAEKIKSSGFDTAVRAYETEDGTTVYGVFVIMHGELPEGSIKLPLMGKGGRPESRPPPGEERPAGTPRTWKDIFSRKAGYFHAGLTVSEIYTDNAFNSRTDKKSDFSTVLSPGVWISVPPINLKPKGLDPISARSPGGLSLSRERGEGSRRYHAFLLYQSDFPQYSKYSPSGNTTTHNVKGGLVYNFPFGLSVEVNNEFARSYEIVDPVLAQGEVDKFRSNLFYAMAFFDTGNRFRFRFDYSNLLLQYDAERNKQRNREDNSFSGYLFYKLRPKTSLFAQYAFTDIRYANDMALNSKEYNLFGGFHWDVTAKSKGSVKAGWGIKDFVNFVTREFILEAKVDHRFSPKTALTLTAFRKTNETNIPDTFFVLVQGFHVKYQQMVTYKITGALDFAYTNESYGRDLTFGGKTAKRKDNVYQVSPGLQYEFRKWLKTGVFYVFTSRESNFPDFNYLSNTVLFRVTASL